MANFPLYAPVMAPNKLVIESREDSADAARLFSTFLLTTEFRF